MSGYNLLESDLGPDDTSVTTTDYSPSPKLNPSDSGESRTFAPLNVPWERRLQTLALLWHACTIPIFVSMFCFAMSIPILWPFLIFYLCRYVIWDKTPVNGGCFNRYSDRVRNWWFWKYFVDYFPITLHRSLILKPTFTEQDVSVIYYRFPFNYLPIVITNILNKMGLIKLHSKVIKKSVKTGPRYIFGAHPHGVLSMGITGALATNGAGFPELFPGIKCFLLTLIKQFKLPFYREYIMSMGISSVTKHNVMSLIRDHDASVCIVVGGASESLLSFPHKNDIVLKRRKGFVKIALELGDICIVPIYVFGETNVYDIFQPNPEGRLKSLYKMQWWFKRNFGFTIPLFYARGIFNYDFGFLPHRRPINVVVGRSIDIPFRPSPTLEEVNFYHDKYITELQRIFNEYRDQFLDSDDESLRIVQ